MFMKILIASMMIGILLSLADSAKPAQAAERNDADQTVEMQTLSGFLRDGDIPVNWVTVYRSISALGNERNRNGKKMLAELLKRDKEVKLIEGTQLPGVMSPLNMLKAAALDALGKLNAREYIDDMREVYRKTDNRTLRRIAGNNILALGGSLEE